MSNPERLGGIIHTYQKYDPVNIPSPTTPPPDLVSPAFEHLLHYGDLRELTEEELAQMVKIDPSQIAGFISNIDRLRQQLLERKRKILETYETSAAQKAALDAYRKKSNELKPPEALLKPYREAVEAEQLRDLEDLYYRAGDELGAFARGLVHLLQRLGDKYQVDELAAKYEFTGRQKMTVPSALAIKEELEEIDKLLKQLEEVRQSGKIGYIDLDELEQYVDSEGAERLRGLQQQLDEYLRELARQQGIEQDSARRFRMTPKAYRLFQSRILSTIFSELQASRTGRHPEAVIGEGATESPRTKEYEFGDSVTHMDIPGSMINAMLRGGTTLPVRLKPEDLVIHRTRNTPKAATCVILDMSGSMRHGLYVDVKRMGLALDGLIRTEYPGDYLQFIEMYTFAKPRHISEIAALMPKPVTIFNPVVRLKADMSNPKIGEFDVPWHFTNIQHALQTARRYLSVRDTPNRQVMLITDGLPTAHFEGSVLYLLYPPDPRTEEATMREALMCAREGITINIFLLSNWNQSEEDIRFAYRMAQATKGRVIFTAGRDLDRFVVWDYIKRRKSIIA
jgi:uncharacterized protein with von Willebrand factor type A (vWA) domain